MKNKTNCSCAQCVDLCRKNPGWMTPEEATAAIAAGHAQKLMRDWLDPSSKVGNDARIFILCPASDDCGGGGAPEWEDMHGGGGGFFMAMFDPPYKGRCIFFQNNKCSIHDSGFKPLQCRENFGCDDHIKFDNYEMARLWDNDAGRALVASWQAMVGFTESIDEMEE